MPSFLVRDEEFTSIQELQAGATRLLARADRSGKYYRVLKNNKPVGVLLPNSAWEEIVEDLEALASPHYRESIVQARTERKLIPLAQVKKNLGL